MIPMTFRRSALAFPALLIGMLLPASCLFPSFDELTGKSTSSGATSGTASGATSGAGAGSAAECPSMQGPAGVYIPSTNMHPPFCIDQTEVTVGEYRTFLNGVFPLDSKLFPMTCTNWKMNTLSSFTPDYVWGHYSSQEEEQRPVQGIDWCDAAVYCAWAGKRLCGSETASNRHMTVDPGPGSIKMGEWYRACAGPNVTPYGYSATWDQNVCNTGGRNFGAMPNPPFNTSDVGSLMKCATLWNNVPVFDMLGNVAEWEDNCSDSGPGTYMNDDCYPRGPAYPIVGNYSDCSYIQTPNMNYTYPQRGHKGELVGVRCCWDAKQ